MLIPSIDLCGGRVVQLVQGRRQALAFDDVFEWVERFAQYPRVQLIDLDAAMGAGDNRSLVADICRRLPCRVGGADRQRFLPPLHRDPASQRVDGRDHARCAARRGE